MNIRNKTKISNSDIYWLSKWVVDNSLLTRMPDVLIVKPFFWWFLQNTWRGRAEQTIFGSTIRIKIGKNNKPRSYIKFGVTIDPTTWIESLICAISHEVAHLANRTEEECVKTEFKMLTIWRDQYGLEVRKIPRG